MSAMGKKGAVKVHHYFYLLFMIYVVTFGYNSSSLYEGDACTNYLVARSLTEDLDLDLRNQREFCEGSANGMFSLGVDKSLYSVHEVGWAIIATLGYILLGHFGVGLTYILLLTLALWYLYKTLETMCSSRTALLSIFCIALTPPVIHSSYSFGNDWPGGVFILLALCALYHQKAFVTGLLLGSLFFIRLHGILIFPAFFILAAWRLNFPSKKPFLCFIAGVIILFLLFLFQNQILYGDPFLISYQLRVEDEFNVHSIIRHTDIFELPSMTRLLILLFDPMKGVLISQIYFIPLWILGLITFIKEQKDLFYFFILGFATYTIVYTSYPDLHWPGRYFAFFYLFSAFPFGLTMNRLMGIWNTK